MSAHPQILQPRCLQVMRKGYAVSNNIGTCPFEWTRRQAGPKTVRNPWKKVLWFMHGLLSFIQAGFAVVQCWRTTRSDTKTPAEKIYMNFSVVLYTYGVLLHLANFRNRKFLPRFVNGYLCCFHDLQGFTVFSNASMVYSVSDIKSYQWISF